MAHHKRDGQVADQKWLRVLVVVVVVLRNQGVAQMSYPYQSRNLYHLPLVVALVLPPFEVALLMFVG